MKGMDNLQTRGLVGLLREWESSMVRFLVSLYFGLERGAQIE